MELASGLDEIGLMFSPQLATQGLCQEELVVLQVYQLQPTHHITLQPTQCSPVLPLLDASSRDLV